MTSKFSYNVVFDFGGVLLDWNPRYLYKRYFTSLEEMEWFIENIFKGINENMDGGMSLEQALKDKDLSQYKALLEIYLTEFPLSFSGPINETVNILHELYKNKTPLYALTNWSEETFPWARSTFDFMNLFNGIVVSGIEKIKKPDPQIYKILSSRFRLTPEKTIFIDDKLENILAAQREGWVGIHYTSPATLKYELSKYLVL